MSVIHIDMYSKNARQDIFSACQLMVDNSNQILKIIQNLYDQKLMCDVSLMVGKVEYTAHRLILCASSDVFQAMLSNPKWTESQESRIELQESSECEKVFGNFLEYLYTGKIFITHTNVMPILTLADKYMVKSLSRLCLDYMDHHVAHAACYNQLFSWLQYTIPCGHTDIAKRCRSHIKWNLEVVANTPNFSCFEAEMLVDLLKQHDVVIYNEVVLFNYVIRWLDLQKMRFQENDLPKSEMELHMKQLVETVMRYIRFPMMSPRELADLLLSPIIREHKEFFMDRMAIGMTYHSGKDNELRQLMSCKDDRLQFTPRLYTSDAYSAVLLVDNFHNLPSYYTCTFVFSSRFSSAEHESDKIIEWVADFYPKGVWFQRCSLIVWQGTIEVPEEILRTVRLSLTCRELIKENMRVHVAVLIYGQDSGVEYVVDVVERIHHFNAQCQVLNIDDLIPFDRLNPACMVDGDADSVYLVGPGKNQLKLNIIITPSTGLCAKNLSK